MLDLLWWVIGGLAILALWLLVPRKADPVKYVFWYAEDVSLPKGECPPSAIECRWLPGLVWVMLTRKALQKAILANRYEFLILTPDKDDPPCP